MNDRSSAHPQQAFEAFVESRPEWRSAATFEPLRQLETQYVLQPWPALLSPETCTEIESSTVALVDLLGELLLRAFDGRPGPIAEYFDVDGGEMIAELILAEPNGIDRALYRGDFIETDDGFRCIEINAGSGVGSWPVTCFGPAYEALPGWHEFFDQNGWKPTTRDTAREIFHHLLDGLTAETPRPDGVHIAFGLREPQSWVSEEALRRTFETVAAERLPGVPAHFGFSLYEDIVFGRGEVSCGGRRIDVFYEQEGDRGNATRQLFGLFKAGQLDLYTGPATRFISDKRALALMSENQRAGFLTAEEQRLVQALIPWTRRLRREPTDYRGEPVVLPELLSRERESFVLKKGFSFSGRDVVLGFEGGERQWGDALGKALDEGDWVVQETVPYRRRRLFDVQRGVPTDHRVVWGFFAFGGRFRGGVHRAAPCDTTALISVSGKASSVPHVHLE